MIFLTWRKEIVFGWKMNMEVERLCSLSASNSRREIIHGGQYLRVMLWLMKSLP
jgi:hypothetical protein